MTEAVTEEKRDLLKQAVNYVDAVTAERCRRHFYDFMHEFWDCVSQEEPKWNWHIEYLCKELEKIAKRVAKKKRREYDLIINVPPGSTKTITCSIMFPVWCWTRWSWMRFICGSYSGQLSLESAEYSRDLIRSDKFRRLFPDLEIKQDKDTKTNFRIIKKMPDGTKKIGGNRYSTSVGGTLTGFHAHILIVDDPINPKEAISEAKIRNANNWMEQTLSTRKVDKAVTPTILIMQRLHQDDPTGHMLAKHKENIKHVCLPGEIRHYRAQVRPIEMITNYIDDLLDVRRLTWDTLNDMMIDLGQYGYAGQVGQFPTPPGGGMFKVDHFQIVDHYIVPDVVTTVRYWDKAGTKGGQGARTAGVKMSIMKNGKFLIHDCISGRWDTDEREDIIRQTAEADGPLVIVYAEQEPGSGGKESVEATIRNLAGYVTIKDKPVGDKIYRADPYSVQVNHGNILLLAGIWVHAFIEEHRFFPFGTTKDKVDAAAGAFNKLAAKRLVRSLLN